jgi:hypothetical protein
MYAQVPSNCPACEACIVHIASRSARCGLMHSPVKPAQRAQPFREADDSSISCWRRNGGLEPLLCWTLTCQAGVLQQTVSVCW